MTRQEANKQIIENLLVIIEQHPELRFTQILCMLEIVTGLQPTFYIESEDLLKIINKKMQDRKIFV